MHTTVHAAGHAEVGDRIIVQGHRVGEHAREGEILEVRDPQHGPPFLVRWDADGHESLFFPGPDAVIEHFDRSIR